MRVSPPLARLLLRGWLLLALLGLGTVGAVAASTAWRAIAAHAPAPTSAQPAQGYEADDHFPGAALLYLADGPAPGK